jgi:hypothetical protein
VTFHLTGWGIALLTAWDHVLSIAMTIQMMITVNFISTFKAAADDGAVAVADADVAASGAPCHVSDGGLRPV